MHVSKIPSLFGQRKNNSMTPLTVCVGNRSAVLPNGKPGCHNTPCPHLQPCQRGAAGHNSTGVQARAGR